MKRFFRNNGLCWCFLVCSLLLSYMQTSQFWFESLQNWQSEFLAVGSMVFLTVFLRESGSKESKPVDMPHHETG